MLHRLQPRRVCLTRVWTVTARCWPRTSQPGNTPQPAIAFWGIERPLIGKCRWFGAAVGQNGTRSWFVQ